MIRFYFLLLTGLLICVVVQGQQRPLWSQHFYNKYYDNPAFGGMARSLEVNMMYRDQYSGLASNPSTLYVGFHLPLYRWGGGGGFQVHRQESGLLQVIQASFSYNYVSRINPGFLSFGGRIGIHHAGFNGEKITTPQGNYEGGIQHNDPILASVPFRGPGLYWEAGIYLLNPVWEAGITFYNIPSLGQRVGPATYTLTSGFQLSGQYRWRMLDYSVIPNVMFRSDFREYQFETGIVLEGTDHFFGGVGLRGYNSFSSDAVVFIIGTNIGRNYKVSYSYDLGISDLRNVHDGSHEILLRYNLNKAIGVGLPPKIIYNPRHL